MKEPGPEHRAYTRTAIVTRLRDADNFSYFDACRGADALEELVAENDALRARAEAAEKDAARYRWLRKDGDTTAGLMSDTYADWDPFDESWPDVIDTAIDAAIAAGGDDAKD